jgi:tetratricopeptide (TPR) repeat protein
MTNMIRTRHLYAYVIIAAVMLLQNGVHGAENSSELCRQGFALASKGDIDNAIPLFAKAAQLSPRSALAHYGLGKSYLYKPEKLKDAAKELRLAVDCDHKLARGYFYLGMAYMFLKKYDYSISAFYSAYTVDRTYKEALYNIGAVYDIMGHESKSLRYFREYQKASRKGNELF